MTNVKLRGNNAALRNNQTSLKIGIWNLDILVRSVSVVGECPVDSEGTSVRSAGIYGSKNAGMSSEIPMKNRDTECLRFPWLC